MKTSVFNRMLSLLLCMAMVVSCLPAGMLRTEAATVVNGAYTTVTDPETLTRPQAIYGDNTLNAGKITVGKSVSNQDVTVNGQTVTLDGENNFLVTISQTAQVMGLSSQSNVPVDVVFVLDTSGSMEDNDRAESLVTAANSAIKTLMDTNEQNRIAVVAFSSEGYGNGTSNGAAANVLSSLAHYTGAAAQSHLRWVNENGGTSGTRNYIAGRDTVTVGNGNNQQTKSAYRHGKSGGTNIQAGIVEGAKLLTAVTNTTYTDPNTNRTVTRIPFLIVISDGQPTFSYDDEKWYDPTITGENAADEQGPGSSAYEGNGFIAALTAAYYKGKITEHYYGSAASAENHCFVYTMGVEIEALDDTQGWNGQTNSVVGVNQSLAQLTLDPASQSVGDYAASNAKSYWNYGNTAFENTQDASFGWKSYWNSYLAGTAFDVRVDEGSYQWVWVGQGEEGSGAPNRQDYWSQNAYERAYREWYNENYAQQLVPENYTFTAQSIADSKTYVNGVGYSGGIAYNDRYFAADDVSDMESIFAALLQTIQEKAISAPTRVTSGDHNFDGYVNFYDPIGEYMEVKDMKGVIAGGYFFQGASFAKYMKAYGTAGANAEFDALLHKVIKTRMNLSSADDRFGSEAELDQFIHDLLFAARDSANQANYTDNNNFDNSFVWWGNAYHSGEEDEHVQLIGFADNDTVDYITDPGTVIPAGADYVCRSYFFYGEAGGANPNPDHQYLYFVVRVQRELTAPYRQTVVISAPASLLSVEKVLINETYDDQNNPVYSAAVEESAPARVVYEVGLWDSINPQTVSSIVGSEYMAEAVNGSGSANYDAATDTYRFFTNDWNRAESVDSHHRAMAKATFDAAHDNPFYTYQKDTLLVDADGNALTANPAGSGAYYVREYYDWAGAAADANGSLAATKKTQLIHVQIPAGTQLLQKDGKWYIPAGVYTAATLEVNGDDAEKSQNLTGTSTVVAHPHRTGDFANSHYTVLLGNNGMLSLAADTPKPVKTVSVNLPAGATAITDDEGRAVQVGDVLTYTVQLRNTTPATADITVTDYVPLGTAFVAGSAGSGTAETGHTKDPSITPDANNVLTWVLKDVPAGETRYVSFQATVTKAALSLSAVPNTIDNTATVRLGNGAGITTNTTHNPPYGKTVTGVNNLDADGRHGYKVGDVLVYHIRLHNTARDGSGNAVAANVTVTDKIPAGTAYVGGSATDGGVYDPATGTITWSFPGMAANAAKAVSFRVQITAAAKAQETGAAAADGIEPATGEIYLPNTATIAVGNAPQITFTTNTTRNWADVGALQLTKTVADGGDTTKVFTLKLSESTGLLSGKYPVSGGSAAFVEFVAGKAQLTITHGQTVTVQGLPAGAILTVEEDISALPGWTPTYNTQSVTIQPGTAAAVASVSVVNTYTLQPVTVTVKGSKTLRGVEMPNAATFGYVAQPHSTNPVVGDVLTGEVTVKALDTYEFTFSPKTFTVPGVYQYTLYELNSGLPGVTYDATEYTLAITVTDNGDGTMSATAALDGAAFDPATDTVDFTNSYAPGETWLELTASKTLAGRELKAGEFTFTLTDGVNTYEGINDASGHIVFQRLHYTAAGTYSYTLSEVIPATGAEGITYDTRTYAVVVTVSDVNGQLVPAVTVDGAPAQVANGIADTGVTFENTFTPADIPLVLVANKTLKVYDPATDSYTDILPEAGKFRFRITEKGNGDVVVATGVNAADGTVTFNPFYFDIAMLEGAASRDFEYTISEVIPTLAKDPNMGYDISGKDITVTLSYDSATGKLTASVGGDSDGVVDLTAAADFENYQNPDSVTVTPEGEKTTLGQNLPEGLSFSFAVIPVGGAGDAATGTSNATAGGANSETTDITFTSMVYTHASLGGNATATYDYWILESNAGGALNGVQYDTTRYLYRVTLSRNPYGRLVAQEQYFALAAGGDANNAADYTVDVTSAGITFQNTYDAKTHINLVAEKALTGRTTGLKAGEFDFALHRLDSTGKIVEHSEITGSNNASGAIHFATLNYGSGMLDEAYKHSDGAFYFSYLMEEIKPEGVAVPGVTYDPAKYIVTVKIVQTNEDMTASLAGVSKAVHTAATDTYAPGEAVTGFVNDAANSAADTNITFVNTYQATQGDTVSYRIAKTLTGRAVRAGEFEFGLYLEGQLVDIATNDANGFVTFSRTIPATAAAYAGIYEMQIKELPGTVPGVTYDDTVYTVYVKVADPGNGKLEASVHLLSDASDTLTEGADGVVDLTDRFIFTNTYKAHDTSYTPTATKTLTGLELAEGAFRFQLTNLADPTDVYHGLNEADGCVVFQTIPFTAADVYTYEIKELDDGIPGVRYDATRFYLQVTVTDDGNGYLKAEGKYYASYDAAQGVSGALTAVEFSNSYVPADYIVQLEAEKALTGRDLNEKEFNFVVHADNENGRIVSVGSNDAAGKITFSSFAITAADMAGATVKPDGSKTKVFTYVVKESDNAVPGVAVDATAYTVTVTVTDDGTGALTADIAYPNGALEFTNTYTPEPVKLPLVAFKELTGKQLNADEFSFVLKNAAGDPVQTKTNAADGTVTFEELVFTQAGTYVYTLAEVDQGDSKVGYDNNVYTLTVTVTDDLLGKLHLQTVLSDTDAEPEEVIHFHNTYTPAALPVALEGVKHITDAQGNALTFSPAGFTFELRDTEGNLLQTQTSAADGKITFNSLSFAAAGEYRYLISEAATDKAGYTADPTVWCVHITVGYDRMGGVLVEESQYVHIAPENHSEPQALANSALEFVNVYAPAAVQLQLKAMKKLEGRELREHEFIFRMEDKATGLLAAESRNHADGTVEFLLDFTKAGTYSYTIREFVPAEDAKLGGITYSGQSYDVTVTVTDSGDGALKVKVGQIETAGSAGLDLTDTAVFTNIYTPTPVDATVEAVKLLEGMELAEKAFRFQLVNAADPTDVRYAENDAGGKVTFEKLTFTKAGVYEYLLSEIPGENPGMTYDSLVYNVTVTVTDDGVGTLYSQVHYSHGEDALEAVPVFRNVYTTKPIDYVVEATKTFEGGEMKTFDFVLSGKGFETQTVQNDAEGKIRFAPVTFTHAGTYLFTVTEQENADIPGIKWDKNCYTLEITVNDDGIGGLHIRSVKVSSEFGKDDLSFRNVAEELITNKDVFLASKPTVSIDGKSVTVGDELLYTITYTNYTGKTASVTLTDKLPAHTAYVEGSADKGGVFAEGALTWELKDIAADETVTVSFKVTVTGADTTLENSATVLEGENLYLTNTVTNPVPEDKAVKDVFLASKPTVSIDGKNVKVGDELLYTITYHNSHEAAAKVTVTDKLAAALTYVEGSADKGGVFVNGVVSWVLELAAGESVTVSFKAKVNTADTTVTNSATVLEDGSEVAVDSNPVTNPVPEDKAVKDVFLASKPTVSIDGKSVEKGEELLYTITYTNSHEAAAKVTVTDKLAAALTYVEGSADKGGVYANGVVTWVLELAAGESVTVSFKAKVNAADTTVTNSATAEEDGNKVIVVTNTVTNRIPKPADPTSPDTGDRTDLTFLVGLMGISALGIVSLLAVLVLDRKKKTAR